MSAAGFRLSKLTAVQCWDRWRAVLSCFEARARQVVESGGGAFELSPEERHDFRALVNVPFPVEGLSGDLMSQAFRLAARALIEVELPGRRIAAAEMLLGAVRGLEALVLSEQARLTDVWRTRLGAGE